ncbi:MAG TPA: ABC transporter permease, partial [Acidobacteriota bacterium]|nr:ABC transporter permease [Acidobacteriota bacterium]
MFQSMLQDLRFAFRMLIKNPGFSGVAILTLALGLGANAAIFIVFNAVVLRPLPYRAPDRLVTVWGKIPGNGLEKLSASVPEFGDYRGQTNIFSVLAAYSSIGVNVTGGSDPQRVRSTFATADIFPLLGVTPLLGRPFLPEEDKPGSDDVVVLSYGLWQRRFGGDPNILGQVMTINHQKCTIVGVMPSTFQFPSAETELWKPIAFTPDQFQVDQRGSHWLRIIGRLNPGISLAQAQAEMTTVAERLQLQNPDYYESNSGWGITVSALQEEQTREVRPTLVLMLAAVGFLLLIACANTGNLVLARVTMRRRELATRMALGAGQWRLIRQTATESMVLVTIGSGLGLVFSVWGKSGLVAFLQASNVPGLDDVG